MCDCSMATLSRLTTKEARKATTQADIKSGNMEPKGDAMTKEGGKQKP